MDITTFRDLVLDFLRGARPGHAVALAALANDADLLGSGLVDSHAFIDLCLEIEAKTGKIIDISELEPEQFSTISGLYAIVAMKAA